MCFCRFLVDPSLAPLTHIPGMWWDTQVFSSHHPLPFPEFLLLCPLSTEPWSRGDSSRLALSPHQARSGSQEADRERDRDRKRDREKDGEGERQRQSKLGTDRHGDTERKTEGERRARQRHGDRDVTYTSPAMHSPNCSFWHLWPLAWGAQRP